MRAFVSVAALLIVLAVIGLTLKQQLRGVAPGAQPAPVAPGAPAEPASEAPQQRVQQVQQEVQRALEQEAARASEP